MYTTDINRVRSLIHETKIIFTNLSENNNLKELESLILDENILSISSLSTRQATYRIIKKRYFSNSNFNLGLFKFLKSEKIPNSAKNFIIFYRLAKTDDLVYDLTIDLVNDMINSNQQIINSKQVLHYLNANEKEHPEILNWSNTTKISLAGKYLSIMKDFKYLKGSKVKILNKPQIPVETILYLIFYLKNTEKSLEKILRNKDFKLFVLDENEILDIINICIKNNLFLLNEEFNSFKEIFEKKNLKGIIDELTREI